MPLNQKGIATVRETLKSMNWFQIKDQLPDVSRAFATAMRRYGKTKVVIEAERMVESFTKPMLKQYADGESNANSWPFAHMRDRARGVELGCTTLALGMEQYPAP